MGRGAGERPDVEAAARRLLGFERLRPGQREALRAILAGRDVLVVMPTGSGKSAVYELAGALLEGTVVVVSPLRALQRDQVAALAATGLGEARLLNSDLSAGEREEVLEGVARGSVKFLYVAPEQLQRPATAEALFGNPPALVAVDEAHCVCSWGHDFRPDYRRIATVIDLWDHPPVVAATATASPPARSDIAAGLGLRDPVVVAAGFDRPNIALGVDHHADAEGKDGALVAWVTGADKPGIVYAATRRRCEDLAGALAAAGVDASAYHAGLGGPSRREIEGRFSDGSLPVVVATTAFGMGIDKPDVRFVCHADVAESLDAYYQEIGRAGRDGQEAQAVLFYRADDLGIRRFFAGGHIPEPAETLLVLHALRSAGGPLSDAELIAATGLGDGRTRSVLAALERAGIAEVLPGRAVLPLMAGIRPEEAWARVEAEAEAHHRMDETRVEMMRGYAETRSCRRRVLLGYFGEESPERCGNCDNCRAGTASPSARTDARFAVGSRVEHASWGRGEVLRREGDVIVAVFPDAGYRTLSEQLVLDHELLHEVAPADD